jgi:hypothetical protein
MIRSVFVTGLGTGLGAAVAAGLVASLAGGCRISLEDTDTGDDSITGRTCVVSTTSQPCLDAVNQNPVTLTWIEKNIFGTSCVFSGCHNGDPSLQGKVDLRAGKSYAHLVDYTSTLDPTRKLVVASDVQSSYLMLMLHDFSPDMATPAGGAPPADIGYMPQGTGGMPLCCQKLDALERWIQAGAPSN